MANPDTFNENDLKIRIPSFIIVAGPSSSGKSTFVQKLLTQSKDLFHPTPKSILYAYGQFNSSIPLLQKAGVSVYSGVPNDEVINRLPKPAIVIFDDLLYSIDEKQLNEIATKKSHHGNYSVIFCTQDAFERRIRIARKNAQYLVLLRSPSSALAIRTLGSQLFPRALDYFLSAYRQATREKFGYLFVDLHAASDPLLRLRTNIFKDSTDPHTIFLALSNNE